MPNLVRSLKGNYTTLYRDPETILNDLEIFMCDDFYDLLENGFHKKTTKFQGYANANQRRRFRAYGNNCTINKNLVKE